LKNKNPRVFNPGVLLKFVYVMILSIIPSFSGPRANITLWCAI
jgi:hypothetical protein